MVKCCQDGSDSGKISSLRRGLLKYAYSDYQAIGPLPDKRLRLCYSIWEKLAVIFEVLLSQISFIPNMNAIFLFIFNF